MNDLLPFERPLGVQPDPDEGGFLARWWAPLAARVAIALVDDATPGGEPSAVLDATPAGLGTWTVALPEVTHGQRYWVLLDGGRCGDPWSRWQPDGTTGPAAIVDPAVIGAVAPGTQRRSARTVADLVDTVIYELHVGTFTEAGDFDGVVSKLDHFVELGITHIELMPVAEFPGGRNWGYDGIFWSAADSSYGGPAALVALVDAAHDAGIGVILDVVYNHVGPTGDVVYDPYGPFFTDRHNTPWGRPVNVDGPGSGAMRETICQSAAWWVGHVGVDGIRVDACHAIVDQSAHHVLAELADRVHAIGPGTLVIGESGLNDPAVLRPRHRGGWGFDADWSDDFHHALRTLLTGDRQGWYADFGTVADLAKAYHRPLVHDGTWSGYRDRRFGAPADDVAPEHFVVFSRNHDQIGNRPLGDRLAPETRHLAALCTLLSPFTPMLFMGEAQGEEAPFLFFSDHQNDFIANATREGRRAEFADFTAATGEQIPDPQAEATFERSNLTWDIDHELLGLYQQLLALRPRLAQVEVVTSFDEDARWLRVDRGDAVLLANFANAPAALPCPPGRVELATHPAGTGRPADGLLALPALAGALVWRQDSRP